MDFKTIIASTIVIAGIGIILNLIYIFYFYTITLKKWGRIEGEILESGVEYFRSKTDADTEGWRQKTIYTYNVDRISYTNDKITKNITILMPSESTIKKNSVNYEIGQKIIIYYNKNNPQDSIIDNSFNYTSLFLILIFVVSFFVAYYVKNEL